MHSKMFLEINSYSAGLVMITGTGIIGEGVGAGVMIGMIGIGVAEETEILVAEVGAVVQALITIRAEEGIAMMMSAEAEADLWIGFKIWMLSYF